MSGWAMAHGSAVRFGSAGLEPVGKRVAPWTGFSHARCAASCKQALTRRTPTSNGYTRLPRTLCIRMRPSCTKRSPSLLSSFMLQPCAPSPCPAHPACMGVLLLTQLLLPPPTPCAPFPSPAHPACMGVLLLCAPPPCAHCPFKPELSCMHCPFRPELPRAALPCAHCPLGTGPPPQGVQPAPATKVLAPAPSSPPYAADSPAASAGSGGRRTTLQAQPSSRQGRGGVGSRVCGRMRYAWRVMVRGCVMH